MEKFDTNLDDLGESQEPRPIKGVDFAANLAFAFTD